MIPSHSLYRLRFTFSENGVTYSKVIIVRAVNSKNAIDRLCAWVLKANSGPVADFTVKSCRRFLDASYILDNSVSVKIVDDLPPDDLPVNCQPVGKILQDIKNQDLKTVVAAIGDFDSDIEQYEIPFK